MDRAEHSTETTATRITDTITIQDPRVVAEAAAAQLVVQEVASPVMAVAGIAAIKMMTWK